MSTKRQPAPQTHDKLHHRRHPLEPDTVYHLVLPGQPDPRLLDKPHHPIQVTTDQQVNSTWYLNGTNQNNNTQAWLHTWDTLGQYNVTYVGANGNGSVSIMWNVVTCSRYDLDCDGLVNKTDRDIVWNSINTGIYCQRCDINNNTEVEVFDWVMVSGNSV